MDKDLKLIKKKYLSLIQELKKQLVGPGMSSYEHFSKKKIRKG